MARVQTIEEEQEKCPSLRLEDINALRDWARMQPHLPNIDVIPDVYLSLFLRRRYYSLERAKETLDSFLTFRTLVPEICVNRSMSRAEVQGYLETSYIIAGNKKDYEGNGITILSLRDPDPNKYNFEATMKTWLMLGDAWYLENGSVVGVSVVLDQSHFSLGHVARTPLTSVKKMNYWNKHCVPISIKSIYVINATPIVHKILTFFRPLLDGSLFQKIRVFSPSEMDGFYKHVPKEAMPNEFGGTAGTIEELHNKSVQLIERHEHFYAKLDSLKVDEKKRRGPEQNMNTLFGLEGSFKKLIVD